MIVRFAVLVAALAIPQAAFAFCGGWNSPVAPGFDGASWVDKWPVLASILVFVAAFSTLVVRQMVVSRDMSAEEV